MAISPNKSEDNLFEGPIYRVPASDKHHYDAALDEFFDDESLIKSEHDNIHIHILSNFDAIQFLKSLEELIQQKEKILRITIDCTACFDYTEAMSSALEKFLLDCPNIIEFECIIDNVSDGDNNLQEAFLKIFAKFLRKENSKLQIFHINWLHNPYPETCEMLAAAILKNTRLIELGISGHLDISGAKSFAIAISSHPSIKKITFQGACFSSQVLINLLQALTKNPLIERVILDEIQFTGTKSFDYNATSVGSPKDLDGFVTTIVDAVHGVLNMPNLKSISLNNFFGWFIDNNNDWCEEIDRKLTFKQCSWYRYLTHRNFTNPACLERLDLSYNACQTEDLKALGDILPRLKNLKTLILPFYMSDKGEEALECMFSSLGKNMIEKLSISCDFTGKRNSRPDYLLQKFNSLKYLDVNQSRFAPKAIHQFKTALLANKNITSLSLSNIDNDFVESLKSNLGLKNIQFKNACSIMPKIVEMVKMNRKIENIRFFFDHDNRYVSKEFFELEKKAKDFAKRNKIAQQRNAFLFSFHERLGQHSIPLKKLGGQYIPFARMILSYLHHFLEPNSPGEQFMKRYDSEAKMRLESELNSTSSNNSSSSMQVSSNPANASNETAGNVIPVPNTNKKRKL